MSTGGMAATAVDEVTSARPHASALTETALRSDFTKAALCLNPAVNSLNVVPARARAQLRAPGNWGCTGRVVTWHRHGLNDHGAWLSSLIIEVVPCLPCHHACWSRSGPSFVCCWAL